MSLHNIEHVSLPPCQPAYLILLQPQQIAYLAEITEKARESFDFSGLLTELSSPVCLLITLATVLTHRHSLLLSGVASYLDFKVRLQVLFSDDYLAIQV